MSEIIANLVCPLLGVILSNAMALAPTQALMKAREQKELGDLNPIPFSLIINSQLGWTLYGLLLHNSYIFFSSAIPLVVSFIMSLTAIHLLERPGHSSHEERTRIIIEGDYMLMDLFNGNFVTF